MVLLFRFRFRFRFSIYTLICLGGNMLTSIKILHISDIHMSETLIKKSDSFKNLNGHVLEILESLTKAINKLDFDFLVISGDISRVGGEDSFLLAKDWIEGEILTGGSSIGLNTVKKGIEYITVPGNHDRYTKIAIQENLKVYSKYFGKVEKGHVKSYKKDDIIINFHLYDSTMKGTPANGEIDCKDRVNKTLIDGELNISVLHHHIIQPPHHKRNKTLELIDTRRDAGYLLNCGFDAILFGHTHKSHFDYIPYNLVIKLLPTKKGTKRLINNKLLKYLINETSTVSYDRKKSKNGQYPTFLRYFQYLYIKNIKLCDVRGPETFKTIHQFYVEIDKFLNSDNYGKEINEILKKKVLISMAPTACQVDSDEHGFHTIEFIFDELKNKKSIKVDSYILRDSKVKVKESELYNY